MTIEPRIAGKGTRFTVVEVSLKQWEDGVTVEVKSPTGPVQAICNVHMDGTLHVYKGRGLPYLELDEQGAVKVVYY